MYWVCVWVVVIVSPCCLCVRQEYDTMEYPKSLEDKEACGRLDSDRAIYVCDPNKLLKNGYGETLDVQIETVMNETRCACATNVCTQADFKGYPIKIVLVKKLKLPSPGETEDRIATDLERAMTKASEFASVKLMEWRDPGRCHDDVLLLYSIYDGVIYTVTGEEAGKKLGPYTIAAIAQNRRADLRKDVYLGISLIVSDFKAVFLDLYETMPHKTSKPKFDAVRGEAVTTSGVVTTCLLPFLILLAIH